MAHRKFSPTFPGDLKASKFSLPCPPFWTEESKRKKKPQPSCCAWLFPIHSSVRLLKVNKKKKIQVSSSCLNRASSREGSNPSREKLIELIWKDTNFFFKYFRPSPLSKKRNKIPPSFLNPRNGLWWKKLFWKQLKFAFGSEKLEKFMFESIGNKNLNWLAFWKKAWKTHTKVQPNSVNPPNQIRLENKKSAHMEERSPKPKILDICSRAKSGKTLRRFRTIHQCQQTFSKTANGIRRKSKLFEEKKKRKQNFWISTAPGEKKKLFDEIQPKLFRQTQINKKVTQLKNKTPTTRCGCDIRTFTCLGFY